MISVICADGADIVALSGLDWGSAAGIVTPDFPFAFEPVRVADERISDGGRRWARQRYEAWRADIVWTLLTQAERDAIETWWQATRGWRHLFALRVGVTAYLGTMPAERFPLRCIGGPTPHYSMDGAVVFEAIARATGLP